MKKRITLLIVCVLLAVTACGNSIERQIAKQLELGEKYLTELNYEEAIVALQKVIDLEPRNVEVYLQLAEVYVQMKDYDRVIEILEQGYQNTQNEDVLEKLEKVKQEKTDREMDAMLEPVYEYMLAKNIDGAVGLLREESYLNIREKTEKTEIFYTKDDSNILGVYMTYPTGRNFYYLGTYEDEKRSGEGMWLSVYETGYDFFQGEWKNDYPNGYGEDTAVYFTDHGYLHTEILKGNFINGAADGEIKLDTGDTVYKIIAHNGIPVKIKDSHYDNSIVVGVSEDGFSEMHVSGAAMYGVYGAMKGD